LECGRPAFGIQTVKMAWITADEAHAGTLVLSMRNRSALTKRGSAYTRLEHFARVPAKCRNECSGKTRAFPRAGSTLCPKVSVSFSGGFAPYGGILTKSAKK